MPRYDLEQAILFEDNHVLVINKPVCVPVQQDKTGDASIDLLMRDFIAERAGKPTAYCVPVHRIDRPASGVLLMAKTSKAAGRLGNQFRDGQTSKTYHIWVEPQANNPHPKLTLFPEGSGELIDYVSKKPQGTAFVTHAKDPRGKKADLRYHVLRQGDKRSLLEVDLGTGRHHQIRVQFAARGWCVVGDVRYGAKRPLNDKSIGLHAKVLTFAHPISNEMVRVEAPYPPSWAEWGPKTGR